MKGSSEIMSIDDTQLIEVYEYYDRPLFFACHNQVGDIYLALLVDDDEEIGVETWYYLRVSQERFEQIRSGAIDLYSAFKSAELGFVMSIVKEITSGDVISIEYLVAADLNDECLHYPDEYLNIPTETLLPIEAPEQLRVRGRLDGAYFTNKTFRVLDQDNPNRIYSGRVSDEAMNVLDGTPLNHIYWVLLEKTRTINSTTGNIEEKYKLLHLTPAHS